MPILTTALLNLIVVVLIGVVAGLVFRRAGQSWFARNIGGARHTDVTTSLVGIAGAFIGFHIGVVLGLIPLPLMQYLLAVVGAFVVLWLWRGR
jgi:uncharacterized membrane protein YeaQ/YmgE (transglycosylase-associated protein family)